MTQREPNVVARPLPGNAVTRAPSAREENTQLTGAGSIFTPSPPTAQSAPGAPPQRPFFSPERARARAEAAPRLESGPALESGTRIHQYELIRQLGSGGMGTVFLARDTRLGRRVAIKFLHTTTPEITRRFILEARATASCSHENIVIIYEVGEFEGSPYMVLEYLQGQPLSKAAGSGRLPPPRAVEWMVPVVRALGCAHGQGIVHRDLKPENIFVTDAGTLKVLDFGIAKLLQKPERSSEQTQEGRAPQAEETHGPPRVLKPGETPPELTRGGALMGTLSYMSPEQWRGGAEVDHRTDIWAVGIMLFRMLAGKHPLDPLRGAQLAVTGFLDEPMPRLRAVAPEVPAGLADVVDRCLLKNKEQRFPDALSLLRALEPFLPGQYARELSLDESPYPGLSSFQEADANRFFGRSREIAALANRIHDQPLMAVVGPSGAGKSSFVRAGVVPALKRSGEAWEVLVIRPGRDPLAALANSVAPLISSSTTVADDLRAQEELITRMRHEPGYVGAVLRNRARRSRQSILLFVDQFEELYTQVYDASERRAFTSCLAGIADDATSPIRVLLSLRSDFLDRVPEDEHFMAELSHGLFFLTLPSLEGLRDALVAPAEMAGYRFETPAMVASMLQHLEATQGALPLLQFAASQLWEQRDPERKLLTEQRYAAMGGIAGALASHADRVLAEVPAQARELARALFLRLVTPERTRAIVSMEELGELSQDGAALQRLMELLVQARLLVVQTGGSAGGATVEIVHESLIHSWPTLRRWLDEGQEDTAFLEQLRVAARQWQAKERDSDLLWRGELVEEAQRFQRRYRGELPRMQQDFLAAVFALAARDTRRKRTLAVGAMVFLGLLVAASSVALLIIRESKQEAVRQKQEAVRQAEAAQLAEAEQRKAKDEAERNLAEAQAKEQQRREALENAVRAKAEAESAKERLSAA
ncbi:MAG: protein kinase domain-containing protein, partial [Hyalangium sp.]|uniref:nSTAND1 domain-containing NTPase n=1 Tax=Hyalangium sp. TaxID=2028555 RepID=UPI00389A181D